MYTVRDLKTLCYRTLNQRWPSALVWDDSMLWYINMALNDIYTFEWRSWTFQKHKQVILPADMPDSTSTVTLLYPIVKIMYVKDLTNRIQKFDILYLDEELEQWQVAFDMHEKAIRVYKNDSWYNIHYVWAFNKLTSLDEVIPLPDTFIAPLYNLVMSYALNTYWQYWDNKLVTAYQAAQQQLKNLSQYDWFQITKVKSNIV